jgi:hypothetical protein
MRDFEVVIRMYVSAVHKNRNYDVITFSLIISAEGFEDATDRVNDRLIPADGITFEIVQINGTFERKPYDTA